MIDKTNLPPELVAQLSKTKLGQTKYKEVLNCLNTKTGKSLDDILVESFKKNGTIFNRAKLRSTIDRWIFRGLVVSDGRGKYKAAPK